MEELINRFIRRGVDGFMDESRQGMALEDDVCQKDREDEERLEQQYMELDIPRAQRFLINDYIACVKTAGARSSEISYMAGIKDAVEMFARLGLLKG